LTILSYLVDDTFLFGWRYFLIWLTILSYLQ